MYQVFIDNKLVALFMESIDCRDYVEFLYRTRKIDSEATLIIHNDWCLRTKE